ncbi:U3 small nucleolar RNA-associated protein 21 [[Candida] railenensis]|uniref:U3 small nucleolar RNA-associated protein 21 n=1 Tax=[Candida] railenensis TaxID=45579 RepID=A0A9P0QUI1_9ASCO|nr:U3 small nucleolar RNA-associated protein 21 [[Candida] railenensis]
MVEAKKRKVSQVTKVAKPSRIFSPFRVVGNVSNETKFAIGTLGSTFYIVTSVGRSFQIYDAATLHLLFVSQNQTPSRITFLAAHFHFVYAGYDGKVGIYKRGRLVETVDVSEDDRENVNISNILVFGDYMIVTVGEKVKIFKKNAETKLPTETYTTLSINAQLDGQIVDLVHPPTYLNKIVVATTNNLFIFNIRTGKLLYKTPDQQFETGMSGKSSISCIETAPVLDVLAVGTSVGKVYLYHMKKGKVLSEILTNPNEGQVSAAGSKVTSISFRTDGSSHLVAGLNSGDLFFYDLEKQARVHILRGAHKDAYGGVANAKFLNGQPIVVTNGGDNHLKEYVFDPSLSTTNSSIVSPPRHLRSRGGHSSPPVAIEFPHEDKSHFLLSASRDRTFWSFSLRKDAQAQEFSQRPLASVKRVAGPSMREKFSEISCIASSQAREDDWENILTGHQDEKFARTWSSKSKRVGRHQLATIDGGVVKSVCISHCGNFGVVGSSEGGIGSYNLQSGLIRKKYVLHKKAVTGLAIDGMNRKMVSTGLDGVVGFYDFTQSKYLGKLQLEGPITSMQYHKSSDLIACALDDLSIVIIDVITQRVVRILYGHTNRITSMCFSPDGRWIVSVALDGTLRTWDLPTGGCIDGVRLPSVATIVKFSPLGDMIATTHVNGNGISLWTNRAQFKGGVSTRHVEEEEFSTILLPNASGDGGSTILDGALDDEVDEDDHLLNSYTPLDQIDKNLITLTVSESRSKYSNLLHLDTIKQRNKPKEAPKKPENAPFFLQLTGEAVGDRASVAEGAKQSNGDASNGADSANFDDSSSKLRKLKEGTHAFESEFTRLLREGAVTSDFTEFLSNLVSLSPATTDLEIRSLNTFPPLTEVTNFVDALTQGLVTNENYDLYQVIFSLFLKHHGDVVKNFKDAKLSEALDNWAEANTKGSDNMDELVKYCSGVISFLTTV